MRKAVEELKKLRFKADLLNPSERDFLNQYIELSKSALSILLDFTDKPGVNSIVKGLEAVKKMKRENWSALRNSEKGLVIIDLKEGIDTGIKQVERGVNLESNGDNMS